MADRTINWEDYPEGYDGVIKDGTETETTQPAADDSKVETVDEEIKDETDIKNIEGEVTETSTDEKVEETEIPTEGTDVSDNKDAEEKNDVPTNIEDTVEDVPNDDTITTEDIPNDTLIAEGDEMESIDNDNNVSVEDAIKVVADGIKGDTTTDDISDNVTTDDIADNIAGNDSDNSNTDEEQAFTDAEKEAGWAIWRDGEYGNEPERSANLEAVGLDPDNVQSYVDDIASGKVTYAEYLAEIENKETVIEENKDVEAEADTEADNSDTEATENPDTDNADANNDENTTEKSDSEDKFHNFVQTMIWKAEELGIPVASIADKFGVNLEDSGYSLDVPENIDSLMQDGEQADGEEEQTEGEEEQIEGETVPTEGTDNPEVEGEEPVDGVENEEAEPLAWETDDYANQMKSKIDWAYNASDAPNASIHGIQSGTAQNDYRNAVASFRETHTQSWMYSDDELAAMPEDQVEAIKLKELQIMSDWSDDKNKDVPTSVNSYSDYQSMENIKAENAAIQGERTGYLQSVAENTGYVFPTLDEATAKSIMGEDVYNDYAAQMQDFYAEQQTETEDTATKTDAEVEATQTDAQSEATETDATKSSGPYANETANNEWAKAQAQKRGAEADAELGTDDMLASDTDATLSNDREAE